MNISIVIPNYNGEELLEKNLPKVIEAISEYNGGEIEFVIVDDGSTDDSIEKIKNQKSKIKNTNVKLKIIENSKNLGFSSTVNRGVKESMGEIIILLNTDVIPEKNFLGPLLLHFNDPNVFAVGCMDKSIEDGKVILRGRGIGRWERGFFVHKRGEVDKKDTLWVNGGSGAFRKSIWDKIGGFNELYNPFYWEDIDLSYRAQKMGYKILFEPKSIVVHEHEKGIIKKKMSLSKIKTVAYRNQIIFTWLNITDLDWQFQHFFWLPYHLFKSLIHRNREFLIGFFQALILLPKIIKTSSKIQKLFVKKDKEIIGDFLE
ncbi:MAG: glycosyltransferase family 2 protein [Candidatus Levyibacteriota bacterium]